MKGVYLLHLSPAYKHARHYIGFAYRISTRLAAHRNGTGARLCQVAVEAGSELIKARVWEDKDRTFERRLKNQHNASLLCPYCNPQAYNRMKG
jgi:predicted GIY-YIG superfamily endonuclease